MPSTIARRALGNRLRRLRRQAQHTHYTAGQQLSLTPGSTVLWESGELPIDRSDVERLLDLYGAGAVERHRVLRLLDRPVEAAGVFVSYRRSDASYVAASLGRELTRRFGEERVFLDKTSIPLGVDWAEELESVLEMCEVMLVVIGPGWLDARHDGGRRLDDPADVVRKEVEWALRLDMFVIPVVLDEAELPREDELPDALAGLHRRQFYRLPSELLHDGCRPLVERIEGHLAHR